MSKLYKTILADPPWKYADRGSRIAPRYKTMEIEDIKAMKISDLAAPDAFLWLWVTGSFLPYANDIMKFWGFVYKTIGICWVKTTKDGRNVRYGFGHYTRNACELCLLGVRGRPKVKRHDIGNVIHAPLDVHSKKPVSQYDHIMSLCDGPYLELFARGEGDPNFDLWGYEAKRNADIQVMP